MGKYSLIPGMESFMEDTSVEVDVEVGDGAEVVEEQAEAVEEEATVAEETTEAEEEAEQAEMIFAQYDRIGTYLNHARKYGVDRTFLSLLNSDGSLSEAIGYSLPACESFDVTGSPMSAESQAVIAGLENVFQSIWNFIKKIARKIRDFFSGVWNAILSRFGDIDKQIGRLRAAEKKRTYDNAKASDFKSEIFDLTAYSKVEAKLNEFKSNSYVSQCQTALNNVKSYSANVEKLNPGVTYAEKYNGDEKAKEVIKKAKELIKDAKKELKTSSNSTISESTFSSLLNKAAGLRKDILVHEKEKRVFEAIAKSLEDIARMYDKQNGNGGDKNVSAVRKTAGVVNEAFGTFAMSIGVYQKAARMLVGSAAKVLNGCYKREGEEREL